MAIAESESQADMQSVCIIRKTVVKCHTVYRRHLRQEQPRNAFFMTGYSNLEGNRSNREQHKIQILELFMK